MYRIVSCMRSIRRFIKLIDINEKKKMYVNFLKHPMPNLKKKIQCRKIQCRSTRIKIKCFHYSILHRHVKISEKSFVCE